MFYCNRYNSFDFYRIIWKPLILEEILKEQTTKKVILWENINCRVYRKRGRYISTNREMVN